MTAARTPFHNHWPETACARAFWGQQELPPYRRLLADTKDWLDPLSGQRWLDLGCGCGRLTEAIWEKSAGRVKEIVGIDCAGVNAKAFDLIRANSEPTPRPEQIRFMHADFNTGLAHWPNDHFDGIVSGLAIQYAESYDEDSGRWTTSAYDRVLTEVFRVLRPGGSFIFSVNVPRPSWWRIALTSVWGAFRARRFFRYLQKAWRMWRYGNWLHRQAAVGRFHYLPRTEIFGRLERFGYTSLERRRSFANQAYLIRCRKPVSNAMLRAA
jgi:SAM-dependent methyltransferase